MKFCCEILGCFQFWVTETDNKTAAIKHIELYCLNRSEQQWCRMISQNMNIFKSCQNDVSEKTLNQLENTNYANQVINIVHQNYHYSQNIHKRIIQLFSSYIRNKYFHLSLSEPIKNSHDQIQQQYYTILGLLRENMVIYYSLQGKQLIGEDNFYQKSLLELIGEIIFENQQFNVTVNQIIKHNYQNTNDKINFYIQQYRNFSINQYYNIPVQYLLTVETLKYFNIKKLVDNNFPYQKVVQLLKIMFQSKSPIKIYKLMRQIYQQIIHNIELFYEEYSINESIQVNEQILTNIIIYGIISIAPRNIASHIHLGLLFRPELNNYEPPSNDLQIYYIFSQVCEVMQKGKIKINDMDRSYNSIGLNLHKYYRDISNSNL